MKREKRDRREGTVVVVGFNARPIALSAKRAGYTVLAVDYWGDVDLARSADDVETVLRQASGKRPREVLSRPLSELLVERAERIIARHRSVDFILLGSGLDDRPDLWERLGKIAPVLGNCTEVLRRVRNRFQLYEEASKAGISSPTTVEASSSEECLHASVRVGYPIVLKPPGGGGGMGIRLANSASELREIYSNEMRQKFGNTVFLQKYVEGQHVSASVVADGRESAIVSVNEQLIGRKELGANAPFIWCGNVVPLKKSVNDVKMKRIAGASRTLAKALGLVGSNGFDFVLRRKDGVPVLIECNPRFQGTLECVEMVTGINLVDEHIRACKGDLRMKFPIPNKYATKMVVFAKADCVVADLNGIRGAADIPLQGVVVKQGDPICTVHRIGNTRKLSIMNANSSVAEVYNRIHSP
jgi:predicted ATP-grasp superfamily ATP-dependent carboligase